MIPEAREVHLSRKDRKVLEACCRSPVTLQRDLKRARIVLLAADGRSTRSIAKEVGVQPRIVSLWRHRYADHGLEGLQDKPRPGKQPIYTKTTDKRILKLLDKPPPQGFARWTGPLLAEALGDVDVQYVWRFLRSHKIDLVARKSWCESNDPNFTAKAADVVGLYVAPPAKAIVLCVDEKPSIQALERAQGYLKLPNGRALTGQSHDYKRHGTTTLFAALEVATGKIIATHSKRRRRVEFLDFMNSVTAAFPNRKLHVILDNLNTHKKNEDWLTPTCNFISRRQVRHGSIRSKYGFPSCRGSRSAAPPSRASSSFRNTSMPTSTHTTTEPSPSSGPRKRSVNAVSKAAVSLSSDSGY
ncbi:transposase [Bradyrhizobium diazoefficiens]